MRNKLLFSIFVFFFISIFIALGSWQLVRLDWKNGLLNKIDVSLKKEPVDLMTNVPEDYLKIKTSGIIDFDKQIYLYSLNEKGAPGFNVVNPIIIDNKNFLLNRGWIPFDKKNTKEISKEPNTFFTNQLDNEDVIKGFVPLGEEILDQINGGIDAVCDTVGTAGTLMGIAKAFKNANSNSKIIAVEPSSAPILSKGIKGSHNVEGVGLGFIPKIYDSKLVDDVITVEESIARQTSRDLALKEGIFCGTSSGMNVAAAIQISQKIGPKSRVVAIACDTGLKYLSEGLFDKKN